MLLIVRIKVKICFWQKMNSKNNFTSLKHIVNFLFLNTLNFKSKFLKLGSYR